ncbi:MAG: hemerythrin family protein [Gallionella sp.]
MDIRERSTMIDYPQVELDFMNRDHAVFNQLHTKLLELLGSQAANTEVDETLSQLAEHTRNHFSAEEQAMRDAQFPPYPVHKEEHAQVLVDMLDRIERWHQKRDMEALNDYLKHTLPAWFSQHVSKMDVATERYIAAQQQS